MSGFHSLCPNVEVIARVTSWTHRPILVVMTAYPAGSTAGLPADVVHPIVRMPFDLGLLVAVASECVAAAPALRHSRAPVAGAGAGERAVENA